MNKLIIACLSGAKCEKKYCYCDFSVQSFSNKTSFGSVACGLLKYCCINKSSSGATQHRDSLQRLKDENYQTNLRRKLHGESG